MTFIKGQIPWNYGKKFPQVTGSKNFKWKGKNVSYSALHKWLNYHFGKPNLCEKCHKTEGKFEWALIKGKTYERKWKNYWRLCTYCHRHYDGTVLRIVGWFKGTHIRLNTGRTHFKKGSIPWNNGLHKTQ